MRMLSLWLCRIVGSLLMFFFKQKTAYELRISDWSSDVCSSDLPIACAIDPEHHGCRHCPLGVDEPAPDDAAALLHLERFHRTVDLRSTNGYRLGFRLLAGTQLREQFVVVLERFCDITRMHQP